MFRGLLSWPLVLCVLQAAFRDRLALSVFALFISAAAFSLFMGGAAVSEKPLFVVVFAGTSLRLLGVFSLGLFVCFYVRRLFENREAEFLLARPISRAAFVLSHLLAFVFLAFFVTCLQGLVLLGLSFNFFFHNAALLWLISLLFENILIVSGALFFALVLRSLISATMVTFGFYILGRLIGDVLGILQGEELTLSNKFLSFFIDFLALFVPRFDLLGQTAWLIYPLDFNVNFVFALLQVFVIFLILSVATIIDLKRRSF